MRRLLVPAALGAAVVLSGPASAGPEVPVRVYTENGVGVFVGPEAHSIVGVGVSTADTRACVVVGFSSTCTS